MYGDGRCGDMAADRRIRMARLCDLEAPPAEEHSRHARPPKKPKTNLSCSDYGLPDANVYCDYAPLKEEPESDCIDIYYHPLKNEPESDLGRGDGDDDYGLPGAEGYYYYIAPKEEPVPEVAMDGDARGIAHNCAGNTGIDGCCDPPKEEPELVICDNYGSIKKEPKAELDAIDDGSGDGGSAGDECTHNLGVHVGDCYSPKEEPKPELAASDDGGDNDDCDPLKQESEPKLAATGDDAVTGINLFTQEFKDEHELRCKVQMQRRELESQVTKLYHCDYCKCPFVKEEYKELHQHRWCQERLVAERRDSNGTYLESHKCEFVTKWKNYLKKHLLDPNKNSEWFTCTLCLYKTTHKDAMTRHIKIHGNNFRYCCPICEKKFLKQLYLDNHLLKVHSNEWDKVSKLIVSKIYTCHICDQYRTTVKTRINEHVTVTHLKGDGCQKYVCPLCSYSTFRKANLKRHSKTHLEEKDYQCAVCKKQFAQKRALDFHVLCNHADNVDLMNTITSKIHRCESCSFKTVSITKLKHHVRSKHI